MRFRSNHRESTDALLDLSIEGSPIETEWRQ